MNEIDRIKLVLDGVRTLNNSELNNDELTAKGFLLSQLEAKLCILYRSESVYLEDKFIAGTIDEYERALDDLRTNVFDDDTNNVFNSAYSDADAVISGNMEYNAFIEKYATQVFEIHLRTGERLINLN